MVIMSTDRLCPIVLWGQTKEYIYLTVKLSNVEDPDINIEDDLVQFEAQGVGAHGDNLYGFEIYPYLPILSNESSWVVKATSVEIQLRKEYCDAWPRLIADSKKPPWVQFDFDRFQFDTSSEDEEVQEENQAKAELDNMMKQMDETEAFIKLLKNPLTVYLLIYNLFQTAGFLFLFGSCVWIVTKEGTGGRKQLYDKVIDQLLIVQLVAILEIFHAAMKWVKSGVFSTFMQVFGRNFILFAIVLPYPELHTSDYFYWLVLFWSSIEIIRYPYYLLKTIGEEIDLLTYLRYTLWVPFYPMGFITEGKLILIVMPKIDQENKFSLELPNDWNFSFNFPIFLKIYLLFALFGFYGLMSHMYRLRKAKIGPSPKTNLSDLTLLKFLVNTFSTKKAHNSSTIPLQGKNASSKPIKAA